MRLRLVPVSSQFWSVDGRFLAAGGDVTQRSAMLVGSDRARHGSAHGNAVVQILTASGVAATLRWSTDDTPAWAPDGGRLAFVRAAQTKTIYVMRGNGRAAREIVQGFNPVWSPTGHAIAFERRGVIFVVSSAGGGRARRIGPGHNPVWSPDGRSLAFDHDGVFVISAEGGLARRVAAPYTGVCFDPVRFVPERPTWSHDGRVIAYDVGRLDCPRVSVVARDGSAGRHVVQGELPQWTPDDSEIVYVARKGLAAVTGDGQHGRMVIDQPFVKSFSITSDGRLIAYDRVPCTQQACTSEIWIARTDGSGGRPLLRSSIDVDPAWRPIGR